MKIEIELSEAQMAAIGTFADEFRLPMNEAVLALAIMQMNCYVDEEDARMFVRDALEAVDDHGWDAANMDVGIFGWLPIEEGPYRALQRTPTLLPQA